MNNNYKKYKEHLKSCLFGTNIGMVIGITAGSITGFVPGAIIGVFTGSISGCSQGMIHHIQSTRDKSD